MSSSSTRALDKIEQLLVEQTQSLDGLSHRELTELARQLRSRRERIQRMIRQRKRDGRGSGKVGEDTGAHEKKAVLVEAIDRVNAVLAERAATRTGPSEAKPAPKAKSSTKSSAKASEKPAAKALSKAAKAAAEKPAKAQSDAAPAKKPAAKKPAAKKS